MKKVFGLIAFTMLLASLWLWQVVTTTPHALVPHGPAGSSVLFNNVRLISMSPDDPQMQPGRAVLVKGDRIAAIGAAGTLAVPDGVQVVEGNGRPLMPGLIDAHIHLSDEAELAGYLAHGVTGVRNMSGYPFHLQIPARIAADMLLAPDFLTTGPILNSHGPNENLLQQIVTNAEEARSAVRAQHAAGYRTLKVYSNLTREAFDAILDEADRLGMGITGHSPEGVRTPGIPHDKPFDVPWEASVGKNFITLEHVETLVWHSLRDRLDEEAMAQVAHRLARTGDAVTPTLIAHRRLVRIAQSKGEYLQRSGSDTINPLVRLFDRGAEEYWSSVDPEPYELPHAEFFLRATGLLHEAGVPLIAGTDAGGFGIIPGASLARELELLVEAGLLPYAALAAATRVSAEVLGFERSGVVAPGYKANLVLLQNDPLTNVGAVEFPAGVMIRGRWLDEHALGVLRQAAADTSLVRSAWRALQMKLEF